MPGRGPAPKRPDARRTRHRPTRGEYRPGPGTGWQHGPIPQPPDGLLKATRTAWDTWMRSWMAAHWMPGDLPALRILAQLYDATERGHLVRAGELRMWLDGYGITPKGQQDRRWLPPVAGDPPADVLSTDKYLHLVALPEGEETSAKGTASSGRTAPASRTHTKPDGAA